MKNKNYIFVTIGIVVLLFLGWKVVNTQPSLAGASLNCGDGSATCLPTLELTGSSNTSLNSLQVDTGTSAFAGAMALTSSFKLGASGTSQVNQITTSCSPIANVSITATTSGYAYCLSVTGVTSSDNVIAQISTSTLGWVLGSDAWYVVSAKASTTAGAIDFFLANWTGKTAVPSAVGRAASTTSIIASH